MLEWTLNDPRGIFSIVTESPPTHRRYSCRYSYTTLLGSQLTKQRLSSCFCHFISEYQQDNYLPKTQKTWTCIINNSLCLDFRDCCGRTEQFYLNLDVYWKVNSSSWSSAEQFLPLSGQRWSKKAKPKVLTCCFFPVSPLIYHRFNSKEKKKKSSKLSVQQLQYSIDLTIRVVLKLSHGLCT